MTTVAVIPARYASTRFPGKPLASQTGKYLIQHVYERVSSAARVDRVVVGTDDERIAEAVRSFGGDAQMTRADHPSGTDRVAEVAAALGLSGDDLIINVQGDEPELEPGIIDRLVARLEDTAPAVRIGTLAAPFDDGGPREGPGSPRDPHCVKVVLDEADCALYFSRSLIPYPRETGGVVERPSNWLLHIGVYGFRADALAHVSASGGSSRLERAESLEQLRWLARGWRISVCVVDACPCGIDTPEDYAAFVQRVGVASACRK